MFLVETGRVGLPVHCTLTFLRVEVGQEKGPFVWWPDLSPAQARRFNHPLFGAAKGLFVRVLMAERYPLFMPALNPLP